MSGPIRLVAVAAVVGVVAGLSLMFASTGVVENDPENNVFVPDELLMDLNVKAAYDDEEIHWLFNWDTDNPGFSHDYFAFEGGEWVRYGRGAPGGDPDSLQEDRVAFMVDDGKVEGFREYGGYMTILDYAMAGYSNQAPEEEVVAAIGEEEVSKFLPETRKEAGDWRGLRPEDELARLRENGYFLDMWHWRAHRSNPIGYSDDQAVFASRDTDDGQSVFKTNFDEETDLPAFMFDSDKTGQYAMNLEKLLNFEYTQDDFYYLSEDIAVPFDPDHEWQEGDVIPRRLLREPEGSAGDIFAQGIATENEWTVELSRALDTGNALDDKALTDLGLYNVAFAVHINATGGRWHYVSFPFSLGLGRDAQIEAVPFTGDQPPWDDIGWTEITLLYPGQMGYNHAASDAHAGADAVRAWTPIRVGHSEEDLAYATVEAEFTDEIRSQWLLTGAAWLFFVIASTVAVARITRKNHNKSEVTA